MLDVDLEPWHDLFVMAGGAAAALAGLLFVAVSLNLEQVLQYRNLPTLAAQSVALLVGLVVISVLALAPGQPTGAFALEVLAIAVVLAVMVLIPTLRGLSEMDQRSWQVRRLLVAAVSTAPLLVAGILLTAGSETGLGWLLASVVAVFVVATFNAWVLLIEIRR